MEPSPSHQEVKNDEEVIRIISLFLLAFLCVVAISGCEKKNEPTKVGIIGAMDEEVDFVQFEHDAAIQCASVTRYMLSH